MRQFIFTHTSGPGEDLKLTLRSACKCAKLLNLYIWQMWRPTRIGDNLSPEDAKGGETGQ